MANAGIDCKSNHKPRKIHCIALIFHAKSMERDGITWATKLKTLTSPRMRITARHHQDDMIFLFKANRKSQPHNLHFFCTLASWGKAADPIYVKFQGV